MENLRIIGVNIVDNTNIEIAFSHAIFKGISASNITIISEDPNVSNPDVLKIQINRNVINIECQPLTALYSYYLVLRSTDAADFISINGTARLQEDGVSNKYIIMGPLEKDNPVKNYFRSYFHGNVYEINDEAANVAKFINLLSLNFTKALYDIGQVKNENYLSFTVENEEKTRGASGFDRLNEESAYQILRVGLTPSATNATYSFVKDVFENFPVSLQYQTFQDVLSLSSDDAERTLNINSLVVTLSNSPLSKLNKLTFILGNSNVTYEYDIARYGYQILDSRYDRNRGFTYNSLSPNQIKLNSDILLDPTFSLDDTLNVQINYEYKDLGRIIDTSSVKVFSATQVNREVLPPLMNIFSLKHAPILDANGKIPKLNAVTFTNLNSYNPNEPHPAFLNEIEFRLNALPFLPGQFSVDYETGMVYVYGQDSQNDGTGSTPPTINYQYKLEYKHDLDYTYDESTNDLVALPNGSLIGYPATITFSYEEVLIPEKDYKISLHKEELEERVQNRLVALNVLKSKNQPITNVFKIYNETSGEIYSIDRFEKDRIYFRYNNPPTIVAHKGERASFKTINNELLFVDSSLTTPAPLKVYKILLQNSGIAAATEDGIGYSQNSSCTFSDNNIFAVEKYYNDEVAPLSNVNNLTAVGQYVIDYVDGIVYVCVSNTQNYELGTVSYKINAISTSNDHILSVDDIYSQINNIGKKSKVFGYSTFTDTEINVEDLDSTNEKYFNGSSAFPYQVNQNQVGVFDEVTFKSVLSNEVKFVRAVFENDDLHNNTKPINFANSSNSTQNTISVEPLVSSIFDTVKFDGTHYYVELNLDSEYISPNLNYQFSVTRLSNGNNLWDSGGSLVAGSPMKLILSGINAPVQGDSVKIDYSIAINNLSRVIIDYNKGDLFVDYTYLADEIVLSYEYGDNEIDFRKTKRISTNETYYVSYKVGALRSALLSNFGNLVNIPQLSEFDVDFDRERYRDALTAALSSFLQGPTVGSLKNIGKTISHIEPEISENIFGGWSLGNSLLNPKDVATSKTDFELLPGKHEQGALVNQPGQFIKIPGTSNLRLEEGTFATWILPQWDGLDNDAILTLTITKDGYSIHPDEVFIGASEDHPTIVNNTFNFHKNDVVHGKPNMNKDGIFIYYDKDISGDFKRWYLEVYDGYVAPQGSTYKIKIASTGKMYDSKSLSPTTPNLKLFTGTNSLNVDIASTSFTNHRVTFLSSKNNYLLDYGKGNKNRISIYKDVSGYINFQVFDKNGKSYAISSDISFWKSNDLHHVATSWRLNSTINQDELHLFIDGFEVSNNLTYSQSVAPYLHQKFRTISKEDILTPIAKDIVSSNDLQITSGSPVVTSSVNFSSYNLNIGDSVLIDEVGFNPSGYTISAISGQSLTLNQPMPTTLSNGKFYINKTDFTVKTNINIAAKISVSTIASEVTANDMTITMNSNVVTSPGSNFIALGIEPGYSLVVNGISEVYTILQVSSNTLTVNDPLPSSSTGNTFNVYSNQEEVEIPGVNAVRPSYSLGKDVNNNNILTLLNNVSKNDLVFIQTYGLNYHEVKAKYHVWGDGYENILKTQLPAPISLDDVNIKKVILKPYSIGPTNTVFSAGQWLATGIVTDQPIYSSAGRTVDVKLSGSNTDFTTLTSVTVHGFLNAAVVNETIPFTDYGTISSTNRFTKITSVDVVTKPVSFVKSSVTVKITEKQIITKAEASSTIGATIRYAYPMGAGYNLYNSGAGQVRDESNLFSSAHVNNYLFVSSPPSMYGYYSIDSITDDRKGFNITPVNAAASIPLPSFTSGIYQTLNVSQERSGMQNGFFVLEDQSAPGKPYFLTKGDYEIEYNTYTQIELEKINESVFFGSDSSAENQINAVLDSTRIYSVMLDDNRVGETVSDNSRSITKEFNSIKSTVKDKNTLALMDFNSLPFTNATDLYVTKSIGNFQSSVNLINESFNNNVIINGNPILISNDGILDTKKEGTIEFWINPTFDTANDPNMRYYFDGNSAISEELTSNDLSSVQLNGYASKVLSVKLKNGAKNIDYFAGGSLELDNVNAIVEEAISTGNSSVSTAYSIYQVVSVKIIGDLSNVDYFAGGTVDANGKRIYLSKTLPQNNLPLVIVYKSNEMKQKVAKQVVRLNKKLPYQNSKVIVTYIPNGMQGDRISIFKDNFGYVNFAVTASGIDYIIRSQVTWSAGSWHRIKASYKLNGGKNNDELRLFIDGFQYSNVLYGSGIVYGQNPIVYGMSMPGDGYNLTGNIKFKDTINTLAIGAQYNSQYPMYGVLDNFRISNIFRPLYAPYGEAIDINYNPNLNIVLPVVKDLYTTYLLDFDKISEKNEDFATIKNKNNGSFDFEMNVFDNFDILNQNSKSKDILEILIQKLKPAGSRAYIKYTT